MLGIKSVGTFIGRIFGGGETIRAGMDMLEKMHTSTAEEIEAKTNAQVRLLESYTGYKVTQRFLAIMFCATYLSVFCIVMYMTLKRAGVEVSDVIEVVNAFYIGPIVFLIVGFYFGGGVIEGGANAIMGRLGGKKVKVPGS